MKLKSSLTSLALLLSVAITGCSCGKNGEYSFKHIEYTINNKTEKTDCSNVGELPTTIKGACSTIKYSGYLEGPVARIEENQIYFYGSGTGLFFKIEEGMIKTSIEEEGEYLPTSWSYKNGKLINNVSSGIKVVYKK